MPDTPTDSRPSDAQDGFRPDIVALMRDVAARDFMIEAIAAWFSKSPVPVTREAARQALEQLWSATLNRAVPVSDKKPSERLARKSANPSVEHEQEPAND